jgi:hypothetical protein
LINTVASRYWNRFAHTEESLMSPRSKNNIVSPQRPAHAPMIPEHPKWHDSSWKKKLASIQTTTWAKTTERHKEKTTVSVPINNGSSIPETKEQVHP